MKLNKNIGFTLIILCSIILFSFGASNLYKTKTGEVAFTSDAPMELIKASSKKMTGIINPADKSYAFIVPMVTFDGFNGALQKEHFNENYIESDKFPNAKFSGKIIEDIDFSKDGVYNVRGKGKISIHGVEKSKTIPCEMTIKGANITISSSFVIRLEDYGIRIPKVVNQKLAEEISIKIKATLSPS